MKTAILQTILALLFLSPCLLQAQKIEVEKRVPPDNAPAPIRQFLEAKYPEMRRLKFYEELNESGRFFEAKFCIQKSRYSVKFTPQGQLVDTEREIRYGEMPTEAAEEAEMQLNKQFQRYKVTRAQEILEDGKVVGYELEIKGKKDGELGFFEGQYDAEGRQKQLRTIEQPPNDFLFF